MKYNIFLKRIFIILKTKWFFSLLKGKMLSLASFEIINNLKKQNLEINTILDVGANKGQFQKAANYLFPNAIIHSFEPIPELFNLLQRKKHAKNSNYNKALGNEIGKLEFNQNEYNHSSSFFEISNENKNFPSSKTKKIEVQIDTLDNIIHTFEIKRPSLLKLDVQGYEMEVLKGGVEAISSNIDFIIVEANFENLYRGQPTFTALNKFLNNNNFELKTLLDFNMGNNNSYIEADYLYVKKNKEKQ